MKIWAKTMNDDKIKKDYVLERSGNTTKALFEQMLREVCEAMDIPCPLILKSHITNYLSFNITKFLPRDFVESIDFDSFIIENIPENKPQKKDRYF